MSQDIPVNLIDPDPGQARKHFDQQALNELAESISTSGLAVPILVRPAGDRFVIVHGERRWRAAQLLGWAAIPAEVREVTPEEARWLALAENIQRADLTPIEEAEAYRGMLETGITQTELGHRLGKSQSYIATKLRFLRLPAEVQEGFSKGAITEGHAKQLLRLENASEQIELYLRCAGREWTVERTRLEVDAVLNARKGFEPTTPAELVRWIFQTKDHGVPQHDPYPEERLPDSFRPPIAVKKLLLSELIEALELNPRRERCPDYAAWLAEIFDTLPPIAVFRLDSQYIVADGRYRLWAARLLGLKEIECRIYVASSRDDVFDYAVAANCAGGLGLSKTDLQKWLAREARATKPHLYVEAVESIAKIEQAETELGQLESQLEDASTVGEFASIAQKGQAIQNEMAEVTLRCERKAGELCGQLQRAVVGGS